MPNIATMMDRVSDKFADNSLLKNPLLDIVRDQSSAIGEITANELAYLKAKVLEQLQHSSDFEHALMSLMSEPKYPDNIPEADEIEADDLLEILDNGYIPKKMDSYFFGQMVKNAVFQKSLNKA